MYKKVPTPPVPTHLDTGGDITEPGSVLKFIERAFDLPTLGSLQYYYGNNLGYTDVRANSIGDTMDFTQSPRSFGTPIPVKYSPSYMEYEAPSGVIPDGE